MNQVKISKRPPEPDPREGVADIWITATSEGAVLSVSSLAGFVIRATKADPHLEAQATLLGGVPAIKIHGLGPARNRALLALRRAFYGAGYKWIQTETDFDWLKSASLRKDRP